MPVVFKDSQYTDLFGYSAQTYMGNAGDDIELEVTIAEQIRISSNNNPFTFDPVLNILTSPAQSWLDEGFRPGDYLIIVRYDDVGGLMQFCNTVVSSVTTTQLNVTTWNKGITTPGAPEIFYDMADGDSMVVVAMDAPTGGSARRRADLEIQFNHSLNDQAGSSGSLIDGEITRATFVGVESLAINNSIQGNLVGNQSGQFLEIVDLEYKGLDADGFNEYVLTFTFNNSGVYDESWFALGDCLKAYIKGLWSSYAGEVFNRTEFDVDQDANTGWFNEPFNLGISNNSFIATPIGALNYNTAETDTTFMLNLGSATLSDLSIGGCYISIDDAYFKNRTANQKNITYILSTTSSLSAGATYTSQFGVGSYTNAQWEVEIINISQVGNDAIIQIKWKPNAQFIDFMTTDRTDGDRLFRLWVRCGNINHLVYDDQLTFEQPVAGPLTMTNNYGFLDHSQNFEVLNGDAYGFQADTEDDIAYYGTFELENGKTTYEGVNLRVEAFNSVTNDKFTLQQTNFSFAGVTYQNSSGQYLLNQSTTINPNLPNTSLKKVARCWLTGDTPTNQKYYVVGVYYPFLLNWRYWLPLSNVSTDFAPNENQNWEQYDNLANWEIRMVVELVDDGLGYIASNTLLDKPYDNEPDIDSQIRLKKQSDGTTVSIIPDGEQLFIESTHTLLTGNWDAQKVWGMLTVEPKEGSPRSICSTIVPFDNNAQNPLKPISGLLCSVTYTAPDVVVFKCKFDPTLIDTSNGIKVTAKIKQGCEDIVSQGKITTSDEQKLTTTDEDKIIA